MSDTQTIHLGQDEDIASVIDRLTEASAGKVVFVVPEGAEIFSSIVNLRLLKREADLQEKEVVIVSSDETGKHLAEKAQVAFRGESRDVGRPGNTKPVQTGRPLERKSAVKFGGASFAQPDDQPPARRVSEYIEEVKTIKVRRVTDILPPKSMGGIAAARPEKAPEEPLSAAFNEPAIEGGGIVPPVEEYFPPVEEIPAKDLLRQPDSYSVVEDHANSQNYRKAENGYLSKYMKDVDSSVENARRKDEKKITSRKFKKVVWVLVAACFLTLAAAAYFVLPKADLIITPNKDTISTKVQVTADKNISKNDYALKRIPLQLIKVEKKETMDFPATGESSGSSKAGGVIAVYNAYAAAPQTLVQNTRFVSEATGKTFRTTKTIVVPAAKMENGKLTPVSINVEVAADQPGPEYNISASRFTIPGFQGTPKYTGFYGKSDAAMTGGAAGKARVVSAGDLESAKKNLEEKAKKESDTALKEQIPAGFKVLEGAAKEEAPEISFSAAAGTPADGFTGTLKIQIKVLAFEEKDLGDLLDKILVFPSSDAKELLPDSRQLDYSGVQANFDKGQINMTVNVQQDSSYGIDENALKKSLAGKNEGEIKIILGQMPEIQNVQVSLWPFWVKSIPAQADKINLRVE